VNRRPNIPPPSHCWRQGYATPKAVRDAEKAICLGCGKRRITNRDFVCMSCVEAMGRGKEKRET